MRSCQRECHDELCYRYLALLRKREREKEINPCCVISVSPSVSLTHISIHISSIPIFLLCYKPLQKCAVLWVFVESASGFPWKETKFSLISGNLQNLSITHCFSKAYFEELLSSCNKSYHILQVLKDGITGIKAELFSVLLQVRGKGGSNFLQIFFF